MGNVSAVQTIHSRVDVVRVQIVVDPLIQVGVAPRVKEVVELAQQTLHRKGAVRRRIRGLQLQQGDEAGGRDAAELVHGRLERLLVLPGSLDALRQDLVVLRSGRNERGGAKAAT